MVSSDPSGAARSKRAMRRGRRSLHVDADALRPFSGCELEHTAQATNRLTLRIAALHAAFLPDLSPPRMAGLFVHIKPNQEQARWHQPGRHPMDMGSSRGPSFAI